MATEFGERIASGLHQQTLQRSWIVFHGDAGGRLIRRTAVVRTRMPGGVGGAASRDAPLSRLRAVRGNAKLWKGEDISGLLLVHNGSSNRKSPPSMTRIS